jgi:phosphate acetyltransferase
MGTHRGNDSCPNGLSGRRGGDDGDSASPGRHADRQGSARVTATPARSAYIVSPEGHTGKSVVALGLLDLLTRRVKSVGVFRPVTTSTTGDDQVVKLLLQHGGIDLTYEACVGVTYEQVHADPDAALATIVERYHTIERMCEFVVIVGSDYTDIAGPTELTYNARVAANLGAPVLLVVSAFERTPEDVAQLVEISSAELAQAHATTVGVIANRCDPAQLDAVRERLSRSGLPAWALPETPLLSAPLVADLMKALDGQLLFGDEAMLNREAERMLVCAMNVEHVLERLLDGQLCIAAGDRPEVLIALASAHAAEGFPSLAGIVLNGGFRPGDRVVQLVRGLDEHLPVIVTAHNSYDAARIVASTRGLLGRGTQLKIDTALSAFEAHVAPEPLLHTLEVPRSAVVTPLMFESMLLERARAHRQHIVLPEGDDERILRATSTLLSRQVVDLTLLGVESQVRARAAALGLDVDRASVVDPRSSDLVEPFAAEYTRMRAHKGMTLERARDIVRDVSYFGTMMVHTDRADGMVSGAVHSTAHTITPAFEIIKTVPGTTRVSSVFLMCLADRVLVYGDCAVIPDPTVEDLAGIAISSAATAAQFGIEPRVAMLSYSTGQSGTGADVDKVRAATELVKARCPDLAVDGPIQYDAAVDASVGEAKLPGSDVAGRATVFIFPDLNTGNNTYKAVQRSAGAVAIGPVLQGLNKPVNDLSRGATMRDIVNTVAITAIQAFAVEPERDGTDTGGVQHS